MKRKQLLILLSAVLFVCFGASTHTLFAQGTDLAQSKVQ